MSSEAGSQISRTSSATLYPSFAPSGLASALSSSIFNNPSVPAASVIEYASSRASASSAVYVFDLAEQVGFGTLTREWAKNSATEKGGDGTAPVIPLQTRAGAGLSLVGRLSEGTSAQTSQGAVLTAYASLSGLSLMAPALSYLPPASPASRLVIQVPVLAPVGEAQALVPSTAPLATLLGILPESVAVLVSATPGEAVDFAQVAYRVGGRHVVHLFDQHGAAREVGQAFAELPAAVDVQEGEDVSALLKSAGYPGIAYYGDAQAETVVVLLNGPLALLAKAFVEQTPGLGLVIISVLRPLDDTAIRAAIPASAKTVHVVDEVPNATTQGPLFADVFGSLIGSSTRTYAKRILPSDVHSFLADSSVFASFIQVFAPPQSKEVEVGVPASGKKILFLGAPQTPLASLPYTIENVFASAPNLAARLVTDHDVFSKAGGIAASRILLSSKTSKSTTPLAFTVPWKEDTLDFTVVYDQALLKSHEVIKYAKPGSAVLVITGWTPAELLANLPADAPGALAEKMLHLYTLDVASVASSDAAQAIAAHLAFLRLYLGRSATEQSVLTVARGGVAKEDAGVDLGDIGKKTWEALVEIDLPASVPAVEEGVVGTPLKKFEFNAVAVETDDGDVVNGAFLGSWHDAAKHLIFPAAYAPDLQQEKTQEEEEEYPQIAELRPEIPDRTYLVTCSVNRRLTPKEYDRNVFHLELDTAGTGLKYEIGEALGIHGWNDEREVRAFCKAYGVDTDKLITIPVPGGEGRMHTRTVFQALQQQVDLFGKPPKSFYTELAPYAKSQLHRHALLFIGAPEGVATFKKMSEKDTVSFADVLAMYESARPPIEVLCEMIGDIEPRHYSIASAQSVVGDRVDLLIVTVDWVTPSGSPKYGQCTRYLVNLEPGQKVTVSLKPSVMKLPADPLQPLILAGLGTGAAPFRAFLQHRALQHSLGQRVGPVYYYFGARYQAAEYLYGEEIEAFITAGVITRAGLAFSRDPKPNSNSSSGSKTYIQHKMREDAQELAGMLGEERKGVFYLCGPTWPVPDVYEALVGALVEYEGYTRESAGEYLQGLKEEERYVLEVY